MYPRGSISILPYPPPGFNSFIIHLHSIYRKSKFVKWKDYEVLQGHDLQDFRALTLSERERVSPHLICA